MSWVLTLDAREGGLSGPPSLFFVDNTQRVAQDFVRECQRRSEYGKTQEKRHGVRPIDSLGADFDPNVHQAVIHESSPEHREGEVIGELARGYMMGDRLLRPAMVKVAKP